MADRHQVVVIPGDGIGPEVTKAVQEILGSGVRPTIASMKRGRGGDVSLTLQHQGKTWAAKADRWSRPIGLEEQSP